MCAIIKMKEHYLDWIAIILIIILSVIYWSGIPSVPFHPDESTQIFMSSDVDLLIRQPASLAWKPENSADIRQQYRLLDAPLTRDLIGIGRLITNIPATAADWSWSQTWDQNAAAGALPASDLLQTARFSVAWLFPFSLFFIYLTGIKISGRGLGFLALIGLAINALVLLHTRRAMAESALLFTITFAVWGILSFQNHPWLTAVPLALAFAAKQSSSVLILVGIMVLFLRQLHRSKITLIKSAAIFLAIFAGITIFLNPFLWADPVGALNAAVAARQDLLTRQVSEFNQLIPGQVLNSIPERALGLVANLYFTPLQFAETGNYALQTQAAIDAYLGNPLQDLMRSIAGGGFYFFASLAGFILACVSLRRSNATLRLNLGILLLSTAAVFIAHVISIPLAFQRYVIPLVPLATLWIAYALNQVILLPLSLKLKERLNAYRKTHYPRFEG